MNIIFNGSLVDEAQIGLNELYRAIFFADGVFESIYTDHRHIYLLNEHLKRLEDGAEILDLNFPAQLSTNKVIKGVSDLISSNQLIQSPYRVKILLWRAGKGTYTPEKSNQSNYLILLESAKPFSVNEINRIDISSTVKLPDSSHSRIKTINALDYVLAAIDKSKSNVQENLITDSAGNIAEGISSNVILINNITKTILIPDGNAHVHGVMNEFLIEFLARNLVDYEVLRKRDISIETAINSDVIILNNSFLISVLHNSNEPSLDFLNAETVLRKIPKLPLLP